MIPRYSIYDEDKDTERMITFYQSVYNRIFSDLQRVRLKRFLNTYRIEVQHPWLPYR
jgi:hypothetical protein